MLRPAALLFSAVLSTSCTKETPVRVEAPPLDVAARVHVLRAADHAAGPVLAVAFETKHPLEPKPFSLDCSEFPPDFQPELRLTFLNGTAPVEEARTIHFRPDC
jgi:hypothetical protein